jgi:hypothetical protein
VKLTEEQIEKLRQSGIRLDAEGRFWHEGAEVAHAGMRAAFYRWLDRNPDGRWVLRLDENRFVYLDVDDAPFVIRSLRWEGDRAFVQLSDESEEELAYATLRLRSDRPYATVKGRFDARLATAAWSALEPRLADENGKFVLDAAGARHEIRAEPQPPAR